MTLDIEQHKKRMQDLYDLYIDTANVAYHNHESLKHCGLNSEWYGKAMAYEWAANLLKFNLYIDDISLHARKTNRELEIESARREEHLSEANEKITMP